MAAARAARVTVAVYASLLHNIAQTAVYDALTELKTTGTMAKESGGVRRGGRIPPEFRARLLRTNEIAERGKKYNAFFFQAEDGIRDKLVTGVQTCALPISTRGAAARSSRSTSGSSTCSTWRTACGTAGWTTTARCCWPRSSATRRCCATPSPAARSEERRVGKECRCRGAAEREMKKEDARR